MLPLPPSVTTRSTTPQAAETPRVPNVDTPVDLEAGSVDAQPLLASSSIETLSALPPYMPTSGGNVKSGVKGSAQMIPSSSSTSFSSARHGAAAVRMYDPVADGGAGSAGPSLDTRRDRERDRDQGEGRGLTNVKLAKNQLVSLISRLMDKV